MLGWTGFQNTGKSDFNPDTASLSTYKQTLFNYMAFAHTHTHRHGRLEKGWNALKLNNSRRDISCPCVACVWVRIYTFTQFRPPYNINLTWWVWTEDVGVHVLRIKEEILKISLHYLLFWKFWPISNVDNIYIFFLNQCIPTFNYYFKQSLGVMAVKLKWCFLP